MGPYCTVSEAQALRLTDISEVAQHLWTTPHVLTEASHFVRSAPLYLRDELDRALRKYIRVVHEFQPTARELIQQKTFGYLGITDTALVELSLQAVVLTVDGPLNSAIYSNGGMVQSLGEA